MRSSLRVPYQVLANSKAIPAKVMTSGRRAPVPFVCASRRLCRSVVKLGSGRALPLNPAPSEPCMNLSIHTAPSSAVEIPSFLPFHLGDVQPFYGFHPRMICCRGSVRAGVGDCHIRPCHLATLRRHDQLPGGHHCESEAHTKHTFPSAFSAVSPNAQVVACSDPACLPSKSSPRHKGFSHLLLSGAV
jgi:hypothetical protein